MKKVKVKQLQSFKRKQRVRKKISGSEERPRLSLCLTNKHVYAQCIDDVSGRTLFFLSSLSKEMRGKQIKPNMEGIVLFAEEFSKQAKAAGVDKVVFDRGALRFHGRVKSFADKVREVLTF